MTAPLTPAQLDEIRERAEAATPGPWWIDMDDYSPTVNGIYSDKHGRIVETDTGVYPPELPDAKFIAHARDDVPALLAHIDAQELLLKEKQQQLRVAEMALWAIQKHGCCVMHNDLGCPGCTATEALARLRGEAK